MSKEDLRYWKQRCELAEKYINESPCDPDIYPKQLKAHNEWVEFKKRPIPSENELFISVIFLMKTHQLITIDEAVSLMEYAHSKTITYKTCYGDGSIIYPQWKEYIKP